MIPEDLKLHQQFSQCGKNAREWLRKCAIMLPKIKKKEIWRKAGFKSIYEYSAKITGMNNNQVDEALRVLKKIEDKPAIQKVVEEKGLNRVKPIVTIVTPETQEFWAKKAMEMSKNALEIYVRDYKQQILPRKGNPRETQVNKPNKITVSMKLDQKTFVKLSKIKGTMNWDAAINQLIESHEKLDIQFKNELENEKPEGVKTQSRHIPIVIENYIKTRSKGTCEEPNCTRQAKNIHHKIPFAIKKEHDPDNLVHLCKEHHDIIHHGLIDERSWQTLENPIKNLINEKIMRFKYG